MHYKSILKWHYYKDNTEDFGGRFFFEDLTCSHLRIHSSKVKFKTSYAQVELENKLSIETGAVVISGLFYFFFHLDLPLAVARLRSDFSLGESTQADNIKHV